MFFNSIERKLKKSYSSLNSEIRNKVFSNGEKEYVYVGTILNVLFKDKDIFSLIQIYASVYTYNILTMGNISKVYAFAQTKAGNILNASEIKELMALIILNLMPTKHDISDPVEKIKEFVRYINSYLNTVEKINKHISHFETKTAYAGTVDSPILVNGVSGVKEYINNLKIPNIEDITYKRISTLNLTDDLYDVSYVIDEYELIESSNSKEVARLWFNVYGTENTTVQPACFSDKKPFSAKEIVCELFGQSVFEVQSVENILDEYQISHNKLKVAITTFAYFYIIWLFSFKDIRSGQASEIEELYRKNVLEHIKSTYESFPYKQILESEQKFDSMLKYVDRRTRKSYQNNNFTLLDDGISDEYIFEITTEKEVPEKIKSLITKKMMLDWVEVGEKAGKCYLT